MPATLSILPYLVYGFLGIFAVAWIVLLTACLRRRRFWPIFSTDKATKIFWLAALALLNPVLTVLYLVYGQFRRPDAPSGRIGHVQVGTLVIFFATTGFFLNFPGLTHLWMTPFLGQSPSDGDGGGGHFSFQAATIEAHNETNRTTGSASVDDCWVAFRRIAIVHGNSEPLASLVARALRDIIVKLPSVEEVTLQPDGRFPPSGTVRPDLFVLIEARDVDVTPIPYAVGLSARIDVLAGTAPWHGASSYYDNTDLPRLDFNLNATIDHESKTLGHEPIRHGLAARSIAEEIAGDLKQLFQEWLEKYGPMPDLPPSFHGDFRPAELPTPLAEIGNERLGSYSGLFTHNESYWRLTAPGGDLEALLARLEAGMTAAGWKKIDSGPSDRWMDRGPARIHIFQQAGRIDTLWKIMTEKIMTGKDADAARRSVILHVHYRERFSPEERKAAIDGLLDSDAPFESLLLARRLMDRDQKRRLLEWLESNRRPSAPAFLEVAEIHLAEGRLQEADAALRRARAALRAVGEPDKFTRRIDEAARRLAVKVAEKAGLPKPEKAPEAPAPIADDFRSAGFHEIVPDGAPIEFEAGLDEPAAFFQTRPDGRLQTLAITVVSPPKGSPANDYKIRFVETDVGTRSHGENGGSTLEARWQYRHSSSMGITVDLVETDRKGRFRITARGAKTGE